MNKRHFDPDESIHARFDDDAAATIAAIAANYVGRNPPTPYCLRAASADGFGHAPNGRHDLDFGLRFPDAANGQAACALGMVWADRPREMAASINCHGPVQIWLNGQTVFRSGYREEVNFGVGREFPLPFAAGWNLLLVRCLNTPSGFGCVFGAQDPKWTIFTAVSYTHLRAHETHH